MMNLKKVIATLVAAMILTTGTVSVASAGGIFDCIKSVVSTAVSTVKTVGNAVYGAGEYVFTDKSGDECFEDMKKSANEIGDGFENIGKNVIKAGQDIQNFKAGVVEMAVGTVATAATAVVETAANVVTGSDNYNWTSTAASIMKDGYDRYDSGFDTAMDVASMAGGPVGTAVANGAKIVKTAGEAVVGYKDRDWEDVGEAVENGVINTAIAGATGGIGSLATSANSVTSGVVTSMATKATLKTVYDLADPNNNRDAVTTILEDVTNAALTNSIVGVLK